MEAVLKWLGKGTTFEGITPEGNRLILAGPPELNQGKNAGPRPIEVLLHALAACTSVDTILMLQNRGAEIADYEVLVTAERGPIPPKPIETIHLVYNIKGKGLTPKIVNEVLKQAFTVESGVAGTYKSKITWSFNISE